MWVQAPTLPHVSTSSTLVKSTKLWKPLFSHLQNGNNNNPSGSRARVRKFNETMLRKNSQGPSQEAFNKALCLFFFFKLFF